MRNPSKLLCLVVVLQGLILLGQWTGGRGILPEAQAQVPDPANRQLQMLEELRGLNAKVDRVVTALESGELQVKVARPDEDKGAKPAK